jgi:DNA-binding transcriptional LysR family regulator
MSQPAVSESVASLEDTLRVRLLDRSPRGVEPTLYARALLRHGDVAFDALRQGLREIEYLADPTTGEIRVAAGDTLAGGLLAPAIDRLTLRHPGIVVRVVQASAETLDFRELRERRVDVAIARVARGFAPEDLAVEFLFDDPHRVVAGSNSPWARRRRIDLADLVGEPWIFASNQVIRELLVEAFGARGLALPKERVSASSILLRNHLLSTGRFLTVLPESVLRYNAKALSLKALPVDLDVPMRSVALVMLRHRTLSPVVPAFLAEVRAAAKAMPAAKAAPGKATLAKSPR